MRPLYVNRACCTDLAAYTYKSLGKHNTRAKFKSLFDSKSSLAVGIVHNLLLFSFIRIITRFEFDFIDFVEMATTKKKTSSLWSLSLSGIFVNTV